MMVVDVTGQRFGRLVVIERAGSNKKKNAKWLCKCDCGNYTTVVGNKLRSGHTQSCGCLVRETSSVTHKIHGMKDNPLYTIWKGMRQRCTNSNNPAYPNYGGRGIRVSEEWSQFEDFAKWAENNGYQRGLDIDRINNDGNYSPDNCRWATREMNNSNKRSNVLVTYDGRTQTAKQWADELGIGEATIYWRLKNWSDVEKILFTPVRGR